MKTHEVAKALRLLANLLEVSPNIEASRARISSQDSGLGTAELTVGLSTLVELSRVDRRQWIDFINAFSFPIVIRKRDASRDILGKLLSYLETNQAAREQLKQRAATKSSQASPELMKALASLLKDSP